MNKLFFYLLLFSIINLSCSDDEEPTELLTFTTKTSTTEIQFGSLDIPNTEEEVFSLTNTGTGTITITNVSTPNGFTVTPTNSTLLGGEIQDFTIVFNPTEAIIYNGHLSITSNSTSLDFTVFLSGTGVTQTIATYYDDVEPIITPNCVNTAGCHSNNDKKGGVDLSSYLTVKTDFQDTSIHGSMHQIISGQMPKGSDKLTDGEIALLQNWIDNDFQEGTTPTITSYAKNIQPIVASSCATSACHDKTNPKSGLNLSDYEKVKSSFGQNGNSWARINSDNNPMPASGKLPQTQIDKIKDWIDNGFIQ